MLLSQLRHRNIFPFFFLTFLSLYNLFCFYFFFSHSMAPGIRGLQLTSLAGDSDELEDVRLLDSYDEIDGGARRIQVSVTGMTCAACSNSVESALKSLDGVISASVALLQNKADVVFNSALLKVRLSRTYFLLHRLLLRKIELA